MAGGIDNIATKGISALQAIGSGRQGSDEGGYSFGNQQTFEHRADEEENSENLFTPMKQPPLKKTPPRLRSVRQSSPMHITIAGPTLVAMNMPYLLKK